MAHLQLPTEIVTLITDDLIAFGEEEVVKWDKTWPKPKNTTRPDPLKNVKNLCLVARTFVDGCQQRIYETLPLYQRKVSGWFEPGQRRPSHVAEFAAILDANPRIGWYVRNLNYRVQNDKEKEERILRRLRNVSNFDFDLQCEAAVGGASPRGRAVQERDMATVLCVHSLGSPELMGGRHSVDHPDAASSIIDTSPWCHTSGLVPGSFFGIGECDLGIIDLFQFGPQFRAPLGAIYLKSLIFSDVKALSLSTGLLQETADETTMPVRLSKLRKLSIPVVEVGKAEDPSQKAYDVMTFVLGQVADLQELMLEGHVVLKEEEEVYDEDDDDSRWDEGEDEEDEDEDSDDEEGETGSDEGDGEDGDSGDDQVRHGPQDNLGKNVQEQKSPLDYLHRSAFQTLKSLTYNIRMGVHNNGLVIQEPYHHLLQGDTLTKLFALEHLHINLNLEERGYGALEGMDRASFGEQWATIDKLLVPPGSQSCALPRLKEFTLSVKVPEDAGYDFVGEWMQYDVLDKRFKGLQRLADRGQIKLTLKAWLDVKLEGLNKWQIWGVDPIELGINPGSDYEDYL